MGRGLFIVNGGAFPVFSSEGVGLRNTSVVYFAARKTRKTAGDVSSVGLSNILYSERFKESSKFFFRGEPGKGAHR